MGISGLLPLLKSIQKPCNLKKFAGRTLGVDAYGWLHRGTVACAMEIALNKPTTKFVDFAMHRVRMLQHFGVTPYIVFDGDYLPSKASTEMDRAQRRSAARAAGLELQRSGRTSQAYTEFQKAVDVTPEMARQLIDELKRVGVSYVVAPYEADAQLAYLERNGIISGIISEDSDLLVFGAQCLLTKLDQYGGCVEINRADFTACTEISLVGWTDADFRRMAILSGCDYLASINKMGLRTAYRLVRKHKTIEKIIRSIEFDSTFRVPPGYLELFVQAELTFLHQRVFCPLQQRLVMNEEPHQSLEGKDLPYIGRVVPDDVAIGVSRGDLHPTTKQPLQPRNPPSTPASWKNPRGEQNARSDSDGVAFDNMKGNKSIGDFFKSNRVPLGELDPNSLTPSPSQQRVLQRYSGRSWSARSAPTQPTPTRSSTIMSTPHSAPLTRQVHSTPSTLRPTKRARLCADVDETKTFSKSPYFKSPAVETSPLVGKDAPKRLRKSDFEIFSDDSIEEALAALPDPSSQASRMPSASAAEEAVTKDPQNNNVDCPREGATQRTRPPAHSSNVSRTFARSEPTEANSTGVGLNGLDGPARPRISEVTAKFVYKEPAAPIGHGVTPPIANKGNIACSSSQKSALNDKTANNQLKDPRLGGKTLTPLQRLGIAAVSRIKPADLKRSKSEEERWSASDPAMKLIFDQDALTGSKKARRLLEPITHASWLVSQGSEDLIVPDSEDSDSNLSGTETPVGQPPFDLGRYAFGSKE